MRERLAKYLVVVAALSITIGILGRAFPPDQSRYREASLEILARDGEPLRVFTTRDGMLRLATLPDDVDPHYLNFLLQVEDRHFWQHPGVDPLALARAAWQLTRHGHVVSGGSTLTMQVALLVAIPQSPSRLRPDRHPDAATLAVARICARTPTANCGDTSDLPKIMGQRPA